MGAQPHGLVPRVRVLRLKLQPRPYAQLDLLPDPPPALEVGIVQLSQSLRVPPRHAVGDELVGRHQAMRCGREVQRRTGRMNGAIVPAVLMHIGKGIFNERLLQLREAGPHAQNGLHASMYLIRVIMGIRWSCR